MITGPDLKVVLKEINFENDEEINHVDKLIDLMLKNIGNSDPELRDSLIYSSFCNLVMKNYLSPYQMENIVENCIDDQHLFYHIGESGDDSVFTRSFSALVIALILEKDTQSSFLPRNTVTNCIERSITYLQQEMDTRGYVDEKGWAHGVAHGADLLAASIKHPLFELGLTSEVFSTIEQCLFKDVSYTDDEDERLVFAIEALIERGIAEYVLEDWIVKIGSSLDEVLKENGFSLSYFKQRTNVNSFLKTLYFRLIFNDSGLLRRKEIRAVLEKNYRFSERESPLQCDSTPFRDGMIVRSNTEYHF